MKIYIDLSAIIQVDFVTGIQRVVREITVRMLKHPEHEFYLLYYSFKNNTFLRLSNERFLDYFLHGKGERGAILTPEKIGYRDIPPGAVFFDIDSIWNSPLKRSTLFPVLKQNGVKIVTQIYDLIPVTDPQFCHDNTCPSNFAFTAAAIASSSVAAASSSIFFCAGEKTRIE